LGDYLRILFDSKKTEYKKPFGAVKTGEECTMCIKIPCFCSALNVFIKLFNEHSGENVEIKMEKKYAEGDYDVFSKTFTLSSAGLYFYYFYIETTESSFSLYKFGFDDTNIEEGEKWQLTCYDSDFYVPHAFCGTVMYQIFPDRFYREEILSSQGKLEPYKIHENTDDIPDFLPDEKGEILNCDFFGGNLKGIEKKLSYLKDMGVGLIYLNPIFMAYSNHRYDTADYKRIDPLLGDENDFKSLCDSAHKMGIKIILDGVFSHTGSNSVYFKSAISNPDSPYRQWFSFKNYPCEYDSWWGIKTLPCVNELNENYLDYIIRDEESVLAKWLSLGADGFRLDVADELPDEFIELLRKRVKEIKKDSFVLGEVWEDASNKISYSKRRKYFTHCELDSVMNYVFKDAVISFVKGEIDCVGFMQRIMNICENYPTDALKSAMNCLSTHDTERILTALAPVRGDMTKEEKAYFILSDKVRKNALERLYVAVFLQFMLPGNPSIYYGDEIGMEGFGDPFCRGFFKWENVGNNINNFYKSLSEIKNKYESVKLGDIAFLRYDNILSFERYAGEERVIACINMGDEAFEVDCDEMLICHNASFIGEKKFLNPMGFIAYKDC